MLGLELCIYVRAYVRTRSAAELIAHRVYKNCI